MGIVTTHTCDRCGYNQVAWKPHGTPGRRVMRHVQLAIWADDTAINSPAARKRSALWCDDCCVKTGLMDATYLGQQPDPAPGLSLEDMLREVIREEISDAK